LILFPQTYWFVSKGFKGWIFDYIVKNSFRLYSRDEQSTAFVEKFSNVKPLTYIDVAFALKYDTDDMEQNASKRTVGINVSGLLWNGGYTENNMFGLKVEYKEYITKLIEKLLENPSYEIHLIPHVISDYYDSLDNDCKAIDQLKAKYPDCIVAPKFSTPMEAKTYISKMDVFTGARMHATIAAMSSGVAVIPFSYSRKFEGLYNTLGYNYCINGTSLPTDDALSITVNYIDSYKELKEKVLSGKKKAEDTLDKFCTELNSAINEIYNEK
jgi:polysaccharide pyruvyl transferase WcaK-like protein